MKGRAPAERAAGTSASPVRRRAAVIALVLFAALPDPQVRSQEIGNHSGHQRDALYRTGVEVVALTATVEQPDGSYVTDLRREHFTLLEDGVAQEIAFFGAGEVPVDLVLMLDTSASMRPRLSVAQRTAVNFVRSLGAGDRAAFMTFGARSQVRRPFTLDRATLEEAIGEASTGGQTALYNAIYVALREFGSLETGDAGGDGGNIRRRAIVVLSDGVDTASLVTFDRVMELARRSGVAIYTISLRLGVTPAQTERPVAEADYEMRALARETGARSFFPSQLNDLDGVYGSIARELAHQYSLGYVPTGPVQPGHLRRLTVQVDFPEARVRARTGYIAGD
jgi:Ca-activated chloride channel family protein